MRITSIKTRRFKEGENLVSFLSTYASGLREGDILSITSKIVALAESRTAPLSEKDRLMREESEWVVPSAVAPIALKDGLLMAFAGIDESNADGRIILLPRDSNATAARLRRTLMKRFGIKNLGVLIIDSHVLPLRAGVVGVALGYAGFSGIRDYRGTSDIFGRVMRMSRVDVADCLASAAVFMMGEGDEQTPLAIIRDAPIDFSLRASANELSIDIKDDLYAPVLKIPKKLRKMRC